MFGLFFTFIQPIITVDLWTAVFMTVSSDVSQQPNAMCQELYLCDAIPGYCEVNFMLFKLLQSHSQVNVKLVKPYTSQNKYYISWTPSKKHAQSSVYAITGSHTSIHISFSI